MAEQTGGVQASPDYSNHLSRTAVVSGYLCLHVIPQGGTMVVENGRASIIMVKQSGKWLTTHMHFSKLL